MAYPFYTPSEYGPVRPNPHNNPADNNNNNPNNRNIDLRNERNRAQVRPNETSLQRNQNHLQLQQFQEDTGLFQFFQRLILELFHLCEEFQIGTAVTQQLRPERDPLAAPPVNRRSQQQDQINQTSAGAGPSTPPRSPRLPLPDIIQCHAQLAFNFCATTSPNPNNITNNNISGNNELPVRVRHLQHLENQDEEALDISLKIGFEIYRKAGRDLREIADDLTLNYNNRRQHSRRRRLRLSLDMDLMLTVAFPALALLGGAGYYVFRR